MEKCKVASVWKLGGIHISWTLSTHSKTIIAWSWNVPKPNFHCKHKDIRAHKFSNLISELLHLRLMMISENPAFNSLVAVDFTPYSLLLKYKELKLMMY